MLWTEINDTRTQSIREEGRGEKERIEEEKGECPGSWVCVTLSLNDTQLPSTLVCLDTQGSFKELIFKEDLCSGKGKAFEPTGGARSRDAGAQGEDFRS